MTTKRPAAEYTILDNVTPQAITSSTDATPIVITKASHGLSTGDTVLIYGHTTNVAANGIFRVTVLNSSTFSLQSTLDGTNVAGSGAGAGGATGYFMIAPKIICLDDFKALIFEVSTSGTATTTIQVAGSLGKLKSDVTASQGTDSPVFGATVSKSNPYSFVQIVDLDTGSLINGATGIVVTGTDINKLYEVNINALKYITFLPTSWSAGAITIKAKGYTD